MRSGRRSHLMKMMGLGVCLWRCVVMGMALCVMVSIMDGWAMAATPDQPQGTLQLLVGKAHIIDFPSDVSRASITDPTVAAVVILSPRELLINAKSSGVTNLLVWDANDQKQVFDIEVQANIAQLAELIREVAPRDPIAVHAARDSVVLTGEVARPTTITDVERLATAFTTDKDKVVNLLRVTETAQIMLKVRFVEVNRTALQNLGFDFVAQGDRFIMALGQPGIKGTGAIDFTANPMNSSEDRGLDLLKFSSTPQVFSKFGIVANNATARGNIAPLLTLLEKKDLLRTLAEPNLLAKSGEEASFLAGGEIPIPLVTANTVTAIFKEFGVRLKFTPQVTESGAILLKVEPEVSSIDPSNSITASGFKIPGFRTRKTSTTVQLNDGQTLIIGGLMSQETTRAVAKVPMASDLPVIGDLFKSQNFQKGETELLVLVSPSLVRPDTVVPVKTLRPDPELAPFLVPGRYPYADAQGDRFRNLHGAKRDAIWENETEADPFLKRPSQASWQQPPSPSEGGSPSAAVSIAPYQGTESAEHDPEYQEALQKYELATQDPSYAQLPWVLKQRLWGEQGVADPKTDRHSLWDTFGYSSPSW